MTGIEMIAKGRERFLSLIGKGNSVGTLLVELPNSSSGCLTRLAEPASFPIGEGNSRPVSSWGYLIRNAGSSS